MSISYNSTALNTSLIAEGSETWSGEGLPVAKKQKLSTASILAASVAHIPVVNPVETVVLKSTTPVAAGQQRINLPPTMPAIAPNVTSKATKAPKAPKVAKKDLPHALIWVCHNGTRQGSGWTNHSLRIVGVYGSKAEAEQRL